MKLEEIMYKSQKPQLLLIINNYEKSAELRRKKKKKINKVRIHLKICELFINYLLLIVGAFQKKS